MNETQPSQHPGFSYTLEAQCPTTGARAGRIETAHGTILTPVFMPVGTQGTVKALTQQHLASGVQAQIILGNTYHLFLRPGTQVLAQAGGLHRFMGWQRPILTDSGGYQVYSLAHRRKIKEEGVTFQSHIDGSKHLFTPESVVDVQRAIGSDIQMTLDECPPYHCDYAYARQSMELTHRWAARARAHFAAQPSAHGYSVAQFGILQGSVYADLRQASAQAIADLNFEGNAIGGLSVGEPAEQMYEMTELVCGILPAAKPRYLMGVGTPANILQSIALGVDMMDCVMPSRNARHALLFTSQGIRNMKNARYKDDHTPIDEDGIVPEDLLYTKAYLRHLFAAEEYLALTLATLHNLAFYTWLTREARARILDGSFGGWYQGMMETTARRL